MASQDMLIINLHRFKKVILSASAFVQQLPWQQIILIHRETVSFWKRMFIDGVEGDFEHEVICNYINKDTVNCHFELV